MNDTGTVIVGINYFFVGHLSRQAFIWREDAEPRMQKLQSSAVVWNSFFSEADQGSVAVRWLNLSVNDLHFPPYS